MRRWRQADQRVADLEATLKTETTNLRERVWDAWRDELHQAHRAAGVVRHGAGRLGQRRRQVRDAAADLAAFGNRWRPVHPDLATDPTELAGQLRRQQWPHDGDAIDTYVAAQVARAHPGADQIRAAKHDADRAFQHAEQSLNDLETTMWTELAPYRWAAQVDNVTELAWVTDRLAGTQHQLHGATAHVQGLHREPALRALPGPALDHEREHWAADRTATQEAADREARKRLQRQLKAETRRPIEPATPSRNTPDRGWGIGR